MRRAGKGKGFMKITTLCYIEKDERYLMLHRIRKKGDVNQGKWIGVGGHLEQGECPEECLVREVWEETGLRLTSHRFRGIISFFSEGYEEECICLYTADGFSGDWEHLPACEEGVLEWVEKRRIKDLNLWEGDKIFLRLLEEEALFFSLKFCYRGDKLVEALLDGQPLEA